MNKQGFYISQRNKRGVLIILAIALCIVFTPRILVYFQKKETYTISSESVDSLQQQIRKKKAKSFDKTSRFHKRKQYTRPASKFDPNSYSLDDWMKIGLTEKQANVVLKFAAYGLRSNEDLRKIVVISNELYDLIKDSTFYPVIEKDNLRKKDSYTANKIKIVELNNATLEDLDQIPGIGSFYAKNILNYREKLGGYYKSEQLLEVWKMTDEVYKKAVPYVKVEPSAIKKINLNKTNVSELKNHPYFTWNIANSLIKLRDKKGGFQRLDEIKESVLINDEIFEKIKPYVSL